MDSKNRTTLRLHANGQNITYGSPAAHTLEAGHAWPVHCKNSFALSGKTDIIELHQSKAFPKNRTAVRGKNFSQKVAADKSNQRLKVCVQIP